jgi:hypothetical protein
MHTKTQKHKNTKTKKQKHKNTKTQKQRNKNTKTQKHKNKETKTQKHKNTKTHDGPKTTDEKKEKRRGVNERGDFGAPPASR